MRKVASLIFIFLVLVATLSPSKTLASTQDFTIQSLTADYYLDRNEAQTSTLTIEEEIVVEFPDYDQNHGILRAIPRDYQGHTVNLEILSVTDAGWQPYPYTTYGENNNEVLKIGDASTYVHGLKTYRIRYKLKNVINFQEGGDEFYWDINGDQWKQPISAVTGRLHLNNTLTQQLNGEPTCYSGSVGSKEKDCTIARNNTGQGTIITVRSNDTTLSGQNTTMVIGFSRGTFVLGPEIAEANRRALLIFIAIVGGSLILPLLTFVICYRKWRMSGRDPKGRGVIIPEYVSPKNLTVMASSFILNQTFVPKAASAGIIEMAVHGYLRLSEIKTKKFIGSSTDYELEVIKPLANLPQDQQLILGALFDDDLSVGSKTKVSNQKHKLSGTIKKAGDYFARSLTELGYFQSDPQKARNKLLISAIVMFFIGIAIIIILPLGIGFILSAPIALIFALIMPARTEQGARTKEYLLGLKEYIKMAEADRLNYLQSPQGVEKKQISPDDPKQQIKLFEDLLPYAILFGLEKDWATQFNDLYTQPPNWYAGNMNAFNAGYLASSLHNFSAANAASFVAPSSSGSSGFGGGGFSGGGGGGGGGGGW